MEKRSTSEIATSIRDGSRYVYSENMVEKRPYCVQPYNPSRAEYAIADDYINAEDFFLLEMVYEMQFATPELLFLRINVGIERKERAALAIKKTNLARNMDVLKKRLENLASIGFLMGKELRMKDEADKNKQTVISRVYYISTEGFRCFTKRFEKTLFVPACLGGASLTENLRWIAANRVAYSFAAASECESVTMNDAVNIKKKRELLYGRLVFQHPDSPKKVNVILEPIYFKHDESTIDAEDYRNNVIHRLALMKDAASEFDKNGGVKTYIVFLVENGPGLRTLQKMIKDVDEGFFVSNAFYTSENTVFDSCVKGGNGLDSLLGMYYGENEEIRFRQYDLPLVVDPEE